MRRLLLVVMALLFLTGCANDDLDSVLELRSALQGGNGCRFHAQITADYVEEVYVFGMDCVADEKGNLSFTVTEPETIEGISGKIEDEKGQLIFDDQVLAFSLMADGQITPVSAPWVLIRTLRGGYINGCTSEDAGILVVIDDSYEEDALKLNILLDTEELPSFAEIFYDGRRILSIEVSDFAFV